MYLTSLVILCDSKFKMESGGGRVSSDQVSMDSQQASPQDGGQGPLKYSESAKLVSVELWCEALESRRKLHP